MNLHISLSVVTRLLITSVIVLTIIGVGASILVHVVGNDLRGLAWKFWLDSEESVPTWWASLTLMLCAILAGLIAHAERRLGNIHYLRHWQGLALIFALFSVDETAAFHEMVGGWVSSAYEFGGWFYFSWVIPGAAFVLIVGMAYGRFLLDLPPTTRRYVLIAAILYIGGALGLELVGSRYAYNHGADNLRYVMLANVEELFEMLGVIVLVYALLSYLTTRVTDITLCLGASEDKSLGN